MMGGGGAAMGGAVFVATGGTLTIDGTGRLSGGALTGGAGGGGTGGTYGAGIFSQGGTLALGGAGATRLRTPSPTSPDRAARRRRTVSAA